MESTMETTKQILDRMEAAFEEEAGFSPRQVSDTGLRLRVLAGELTRLRAEVLWLRRQAFPQTATGEWLDRHGEARGVTRRLTHYAQGELSFNRYIPLSFDLELPAGQVCASTGNNAAEFVTTQTGVLPAGELTLTVPARAVLPGEGGNAHAGQVNTMINPPEGFQYVTNAAAFSGGSGPEDDESYRARVLEAYAVPANANNGALYRNAALAVDGVAKVQVVPLISGAGTVGVYVWGPDGAPEQAVLDAVEEALEAVREPAVTVTVQPATGASTAVTLNVGLADGADFDRAEEAISEAIGQVFARLQVGDPIYLTQLAAAIIAAAPVLQIEWGSGMADVTGVNGQILLAGTITVEAIT